LVTFGKKIKKINKENVPKRSYWIAKAAKVVTAASGQSAHWAAEVRFRRRLLGAASASTRGLPTQHAHGRASRHPGHVGHGACVRAGEAASRMCDEIHDVVLGLAFGTPPSMHVRECAWEHEQTPALRVHSGALQRVMVTQSSCVHVLNVH
jgi:hypothetical protein